MKQAEKIWLVTAVSLLLVGVLIFGGVMAAHHWDFAALGGTKYETHVVDIKEDFQNISIRSHTEDIVFLPSDDGACRVVFYEREKEKHTADVQDGTLSLAVADAGKWYNHITLFSGSPRITIYLPLAEYASLFIEESTGDITIPGDFTFGSVDISADTGDVACSASSLGRIHIGLSTGDIRVDHLSAGELNLSVSTGKVEVCSVACEGDVGVRVSTGKAALTDVSCKNLLSTGSTGDMTLERVAAAETISVERSTGDVRLEQCDAAELLIQTDTGDVTGSLLSEKVFIAQSHTGRVEVPETTTGGKCKITTDTGDIVIVIQ